MLILLHAERIFYASTGSLNFCSYYAEKTWLDQTYHLHVFLFGFVELPYFSGLVVWFCGIAFDLSSGCSLLDIEAFSLAGFGCSPVEAFSLLVLVVLIFFSIFWLFASGSFLSGAGVSFVTVVFFLGLSLLVSKEPSPKDLYPRKIRPPTTGIEVSPPIAISNSLNAMVHFPWWSTPSLRSAATSNF